MRIFLAAVCLAFAAQASADNQLWGYGVPVTTTAWTAVGTTPISGTGNSLMAWTLVSGSTLKQKMFYIGERSSQYDLRIAYVSAPGDSWWRLGYGFDEGRMAYLANGLYVNTTFTTVYKGCSVPSIKVNYDSYR